MAETSAFASAPASVEECPGAAVSTANDGAEVADQTLLERWQAGDDTAFSMLVGRHGPLVRSLCRRQVHPSDVDDAMQAVFLVLMRRAGTAQATRCLPAWLHGVCMLVGRNVRRAKSRSAVREVSLDAHAELAPATEALPEGDERDMAWIDAALACLPSTQRHVLCAHYLAGQTPQAIADASCRSLAAVYQDLHRGLKTLRRRLGGSTILNSTLATLSLVAVANSRAAGSDDGALAAQLLQGHASACATATARNIIVSMSIKSFTPIAVIAAILSGTAGAILAVEAKPAPTPEPQHATTAVVNDRQVSVQALVDLVSTGRILLYVPEQYGVTDHVTPNLVLFLGLSSEEITQTNALLKDATRTAQELLSRLDIQFVQKNGELQFSRPDPGYKGPALVADLRRGLSEALGRARAELLWKGSRFDNSDWASPWTLVGKSGTMDVNLKNVDGSITYDIRAGENYKSSGSWGNQFPFQLTLLRERVPVEYLGNKLQAISPRSAN